MERSVDCKHTEDYQVFNKLGLDMLLASAPSRDEAYWTPDPRQGRMISHFVKVTQPGESRQDYKKKKKKREKQIGNQRREQSKSEQEFYKKQYRSSRE